ncbi:MAG: DUF4160 domain-containing protein [Bacillota bacterium]|nr:DUF4160 domain-containing protein [Bacillota bacterium]
MPVIARFYGITIKMYFSEKEHGVPHIHAVYGEYLGVIDLANAEMLEGDLPRKALSMVQEWVLSHQTELKEMWEAQDFKKLPPLE